MISQLVANLFSCSLCLLAYTESWVYYTILNLMAPVYRKIEGKWVSFGLFVSPLSLHDVIRDALRVLPWTYKCICIMVVMSH